MPATEPQAGMLYPPADAMRGAAGGIIPAWYAPETPPYLAEALLRTTLGPPGGVLEPRHLLVCVDGSPVASAAAAALQGEWTAAGSPSFTVLELPENQGKGAALAAGLRALLADGGLDWFAIRDADGDHFLDDLPHLFRAGEQAASLTPERPIVVVGSRSSVHAALGWRRGEFELLLNEMVIEAVSMALARSGKPWDTRYLASRYPDLQSGYKLYNRTAATLALQSLTEEPERDPSLGLGRTGMEVVPFVSAMLAGGTAVEVERKAFFDQPVTSYGHLEPAAFYGPKLLWTLRRCLISAEAATVLFDGALVKRPLFTDPQGREHALKLRRQVLSGLDASPALLNAEPNRRHFV